ncbi:MAG: DUF697 domain-containing protein [Bacteroidales bacterium]|nr:DUF697 domain-containing protein [Bacteroidales bacterium]
MVSDNWDDEERVGIPRAGRAPVLPVDQEPSLAVAPPEVPAEEITLRIGDTELGRPIPIPQSVAPLTDADRKAIRQADEAQALQELAEAEELLASNPEVGWLNGFAQPLAVAFLLGSVGVLGLFVYSQAIAVLGHLAVQPWPILIPGSVALAILTGAVGYALLQFVFLYARLRRNRQIRITGLNELQARTRLRWLATAKSREARDSLTTYLREFPISTEREHQTLQALGFPPETIRSLSASRTELLDEARFTSTSEWFQRFRDDFQGQLDQVADQRVSYWANRAMLVTAVSPNGLVDSVSTLYFGFAMLTDLCRVYNLKAGRTGTAVMLGRVFFNAYLAGNLNDVEKLAEDQYDQLFEQGFQVVGIGVSSNVVTKFLGKVGAKATTGYLNRVLLNRLGRYACRLLRPVTPH